jgi:hypothetical protein
MARRLGGWEVKRQRSAQPLAAVAASLIKNRDFGIPSQIQETSKRKKTEAGNLQFVISATNHDFIQFFDKRIISNRNDIF